MRNCSVWLRQTGQNIRFSHFFHFLNKKVTVVSSDHCNFHMISFSIHRKTFFPIPFWLKGIILVDSIFGKKSRKSPKSNIIEWGDIMVWMGGSLQVMSESGG